MSEERQICECSHTQESHYKEKQPLEKRTIHCVCGKQLELAQNRLTLSCLDCGRVHHREPFRYGNCNAIWCECPGFRPEK